MQGQAGKQRAFEHDKQSGGRRAAVSLSTKSYATFRQPIKAVVALIAVGHRALEAYPTHSAVTLSAGHGLGQTETGHSHSIVNRIVETVV